MSWKFNPPPGWPEQPAGWVPPPGWTPEPGWPPPPAGWQFWVPADQPTPTPTPMFTPTPTPMSTPTPSPVHGYPPIQPYPAHQGYPPTQTYPGSGAPPGGRAWFARWWGILILVGALVIGGLLGFGGTSLGLAASGEDDPPPQPAPAPAPAPAPTETPELDLPTLPPIPTEPPAGASEVCGEVAVIMLLMVGEQLNANEADDPRTALVNSRRTAATGLRDIETADDTEREALDTFADELDSAADYLEQGAFTERRVDEFLTRSTDAWDEFNATAGC